MRICTRQPDGKLVNCVIVGGVGGPVWPGQRNRDSIVQSAQVPGVYPELYIDASAVNTIHFLTKGIADKGVRDALQSGIDSAVKALQKRGGEKVVVTLDEEALGKSA